MDDANNIDHFELLLKKNTGAIPSALYKTADLGKTTIKPQDVLHSVYSQIKTIQMADGRSSKFVGKEMNKVKSSFLAVNKLPLYNEVPKQTNTFETQCVSDTQLINIIEDAEALINTHKGMTQEFDTVFTHTNKENKSNSLTFTQKIDRENMPETQEFETSFTQTNVDETISFLEDKIDNSPCAEINNTQLKEKKTAIDEQNLRTVDKLKKICEKVVLDNQFLPEMVQIHNDKQSIEHKEDSCYHRIEGDDVRKYTEPEEGNKTIVLGNTTRPSDLMDIDNNEVRSSSPILKIKNKTIPPPIVVSLESFESFERIAIPLINSSNDFDTCKHLINSQILGGELCLKTDEDIIFNENGKLSPIIEKSGEVLEDITEQSIKTSVLNLDNMNLNVKQSNSFKDEILFSSDEENDFIYTEFQDMPLTAALDTSFGDHSNVLEETMYVCFQTASNKSIKISTDLFQKAQFILDEDNNINGKDFSLTELVNICDQKSFNNVSTAGLKVQENVNFGFKSDVNTDRDMIQAELKENNSNKDEEIIEDVKIKVPIVVDYNDTVRKPPEKQCFIGFKTASNRKINLSDKAFEHGKKVFKDIDFDVNLDVENQNSVVALTEDDRVKVAKLDINELANDIDDKINDDMLIQEFENIEMSLEEKEKSYDVNKSDHFQSSEKDDASDGMKAKIKDAIQDIDHRKLYNISEKYSVIKKEIENLPEQLQSDIIERESNSESKSFMGFKTANNKDIEISAQALANTKIIFQDIGKAVKKKAVDISQPSTSKAVFMGFKTANHQDIKISEAALSKSSKVFNEINEDSNYFESEIEIAKSLFEGLKTASNKGVDIPKQLSTKSRTEFQDMEGHSEEIEDPPNINCKDKASFSDFNKPINKTVLVSEEYNIKSKEFIERTTKLPNTNDHQPSDDKPKYDIPTFKGFQTASRKPVSVSVNALEKSKMIFQDIDKDEVKNQLNTSEGKFKGFQTASNKDITVAKEAIDASKKQLDELKLAVANPFTGFKTASNKSVKVSDEAIAKCKKIFDDIGDVPAETLKIKEVPSEPLGFETAYEKQLEASKNALEKTKNEMPVIAEQGTFKGFLTASKKKVVVSKVAIEKSKALFNDIEESGLIEPFMGFKTANKKKVEVSKEALEKTKQLFNDMEVPIKEQGLFKGFQTASKKIVHISEQALAKTKQVFNDIDTHTKKVTENIDSEKREEKRTYKNLVSFQTGNNQNIDVSEDALKKSKNILEDSNDSKKKSGANDLNLDKTKNSDQKELTSSKADNLSSLNTQVLNNFDKSLCTEDFKETPRSKRSGSPILSCPKAKRRKKFETPYKDEKDKKTEDIKTVDIKKETCTTNIKFTANYKKNKIYTLKDLHNIGNGVKADPVPHIANINLDTILNFEFTGKRNDVTDTKISVEELKNAFLSAVNANLVPEGWLDNHLKLILWKLLSYEIKYPNFLCTVQSIIDQLKYRYDKELYNAERPVLRKILERDDVPAKPMILCVAGIYIDGVSVSSATNTKDVELLLTDGWYFIKATIDKMLTKLVYERRIAIGCKIITCGAELANCEQGMAPWEDTSAVRLKIFGNSTRPAPWDAILGYSRVAILNQLSTVKVDGGKIGRLRAFVTRVYPLLYVEKFEDGSTVTRSERLEHLHQMKYEAERELMMERIYEEVQKEFSDQESQDSEILVDSGKRRYYDSGSQIAKVMKTSKDPMEFRAQLTSSQVHLLQEHTSKYRDKVLQAIQDRVQEKVTNRNVITLARGRIASLNDKMELTKGMLSIWKPNDAILDIFKEGSWIEVSNTMPTAIRYSEIQITAGRQSVFRATKSKNEISPLLQSLKRKCFKICDVTQNPTMTTDYNEIDTVGMVFLIEPNNREFVSNRNFQNVYLSDADKNIISVNFWGGVKKFGFENILDTGQVVACANLQKRAGNTGKNIPQFRVTEFSHFTKTPRNVQAREMVDDLDKKLFGLDRRKFCDECVAIKNNYATLRCYENESPYRFHKGDYSFARNKMFIDTPQGVKSNKKEDVNFNLTGLDFESSFKQDTPNLSPKTLLRKKKVGEKIARLKLYGEPPPLSSINIVDKSVNAKNSYKSPLVSGNSIDVTPLPNNSVSVSNNLPEESPKAIPRNTDLEKSPVISMKRGYVRSVPVKLNFANDKNLDHFAEEFDSSPPLSLD